MKIVIKLSYFFSHIKYYWHRTTLKIINTFDVDSAVFVLCLKVVV